MGLPQKKKKKKRRGGGERVWRYFISFILINKLFNVFKIRENLILINFRFKMNFILIN